MKYLKVLPALLAAGAVVIAGCGDDSSARSASGSAHGAGNPVDRAFIAEMVPHHRSAVQMAKIAQKRAQSQFVKKLADDIVRTQNREIELMRSEDKKLAAAGIKKGSLGVPEHMMGMDENTASLKTAKPFDKAFLTMMIAHHRGAIVMAKAELAKGQNPTLKKLARNIITTQQREIAAMRKHLGTDKNRGGAEHHGGDRDTTPRPKAAPSSPSRGHSPDLGMHDETTR